MNKMNNERVRSCCPKHCLAKSGHLGEKRKMRLAVTIDDLSQEPSEFLLLFAFVRVDCCFKKDHELCDFDVCFDCFYIDSIFELIPTLFNYHRIRKSPNLINYFFKTELERTSEEAVLKLF